MARPASVLINAFFRRRYDNSARANPHGGENRGPRTATGSVHRESLREQQAPDINSGLIGWRRSEPNWRNCEALIEALIIEVKAPRSERSKPVSLVFRTRFHSAYLSECGGVRRSESVTPVCSGLLRCRGGVLEH